MTPETNNLLLSYYGDDLTGATDVMEAMALHGVPTVLFTQAPTLEQRERFPDVRAIGLAGSSRSQTPAWMDTHLTPALGWLKTLGANVCHYKVCSTFDSSPQIGSIGRALDIGQALFKQPFVPLVVGAPQLKRYTTFGHLFAAYRGEVFRIDRHPVMSRHPVTPMRESDLRVHLGRQTDKTIALVDLVALNRDGDAQVAGGADIVMLDVADLGTQQKVGRQLARWASEGSPFVVGSSGVEYALLSEWTRKGLIAGSCEFSPPGPVDRIAVVSGSCSATTARQIRHATAHGFEGVALKPETLASGDEAGVQAAIRSGLANLKEGRSVIFYTALGPETDVGDKFETDAARHKIGAALGRIERAMIEQAKLRRGVICGGDTSSHALAELGIFALTTLLPLPATPGSPLCLAYSDDKLLDGFQIALKGGQVGDDDYLTRIREGVL